MPSGIWPPHGWQRLWTVSNTTTGQVNPRPALKWISIYLLTSQHSTDRSTLYWLFIDHQSTLFCLIYWPVNTLLTTSTLFWLVNILLTYLLATQCFTDSLDPFTDQSTRYWLIYWLVNTLVTTQRFIDLFTDHSMLYWLFNPIYWLASALLTCQRSTDSLAQFIDQSTLYWLANALLTYLLTGQHFFLF
jgi:hypothetical protein